VHGVQGAQRHRVVGDEDGRHARLLQHLERCGVARRGRPVPVHHRRYLRTGRCEGLLPADDALDTLVPLRWPGDVPHRLVSKAEQVVGGQFRPKALVDAHHRVVARGAGVDGHHRWQVGGVPTVARHFRDQRLQQDDTVGGPGAQQVGALGDRSAVGIAEVRDRHRVAAFAGRTLDAAERCPRAVEGGVNRQHADAARTAAGKPARHHVRAVVERVHGDHHALTRFGRNLRVTVDDPGHGHGGNPSELGDVGERRCPIPRNAAANDVVHGC